LSIFRSDYCRPLWISIDTERTNRDLVTEAAWPFVEVYTSGGSDSQRPLSLNIANVGVGPAKIQTLELFWKGKPYRTSVELLRDCCEYKASHSNQSPVEDSPLGTSKIAGTVLRAGDNVPIVRYVLTPDNASDVAGLPITADENQLSHLLLLNLQRMLVDDGATRT
jgi:hypothetical protein